MIERVRRFFGSTQDATTAQPQREALVDLLLWTMYVDRRLALPENERIDELADTLPWHAVTPFSQYVNTTVARVREVLSDPGAATALLDDIYTRLSDESVRRKAHDACRELAEVDGQLADEETQFLDRVRSRFGL